MAAEKILINVAPGETRVALIEKGCLLGLKIAREGRETLVGNVYMGRVTTVLSGLQAAFIDCGLERSGFLSLADIRPIERQKRDRNHRDRISDYLSEGDLILVQVLRDPELEKGAKLTTRVTLTGRDLVLVLGQTGITLSRRIKEPSERERLLKVVEDLVPNDAPGAFVVRLAAQEAEAEDLEIEVKAMLVQAKELIAKQEKASKPSCVLKELELPFAILRDYGGVDLEVIHVDDKSLYKKLCEFANEHMTDLVDLIKLHNKKAPLFESFGVEDMIEEALAPEVSLPSGGNIIISETPALTAIDVNSGSTSGGGREQVALTTNQEASEVIAAQIQLRNLSGLLVIDFVSMRKRENQEKVLQAIQASMAKDVIRPHVVGFTKLGLLEMTRRRRGSSLSEILVDNGNSLVKSSETIALEILRAVPAAISTSPGLKLSIHAAPSVIDVINSSLKKTFKSLEKKLGLVIGLKPEPYNRIQSFQIIPKKAKK